VPLDIASLQEKLVRGGRGGWCFEHNLLMGAALRAIGFDVEGLAARVLWNIPADVVRPRTHMVLLVTIDGRPLIVDAGFGGLTLTAPLRLEPGVDQDTPHECVRLVSSGREFIVEAFVRDEWKAMYRFDGQPQALADYELASWYLCTHPSSHFRVTLIAARARRDRRYGLANATMSVHHLDGFTERRVLETGPAIREALETLFGVAVPRGDDVDAVLAQVAAGTLSQSV
jgi:N-hydroxyarylamine O-acetyltransferase